jgi:hypothetical protein
VVAAALRVVSASRIHKLVPLLLLMINAGLLAGGRVAPMLCAAAVVFILLISMLGMQLNVLTDAALDRATKPHLLAWMNDDPRILRAIMWAEGLSCGLLLALAARRDIKLGLALAYYAMCFTLYSYNFLLPGREMRARLKVFWWGNVAAVFGGYFALWMAGLALAGLPPRGWIAWAALAAAVCAVDYGVFLNECAGDAAAERAHGLKTLPALLGERRTSAFAISLLVLGASAVAGLLIRFWPRLDGFQVAALAWHTAVQGLSALSTLLVIRRGRSRWEALVDSSFWVSRVGALTILLGRQWLSG